MLSIKFERRESYCNPKCFIARYRIYYVTYANEVSMGRNHGIGSEEVRARVEPPSTSRPLSGCRYAALLRSVGRLTDKLYRRNEWLEAVQQAKSTLTLRVGILDGGVQAFSAHV